MVNEGATVAIDKSESMTISIDEDKGGDDEMHYKYRRKRNFF